MKKEITAIIPAKGMSNRLTAKNTLPFGDSNLLVHKIRQLKAVENIKEIIVSSEDDMILSLAECEGVRAIKRPIEFSTETKPFQEFLYYIVGEAKCDHVMWACCTSPMVGSELYQKGCETYFNKVQEGYDSLITVMEYKHYLLDEDMKPYTFEWGPGHKNSQELKKLYFFTDGIQLASKENMRKWRYYFGQKPYGLEVNFKDSVDIDTVYDYIMGQMLYLLDENKINDLGLDQKNGDIMFKFLVSQIIEKYKEIT
ncbi:MAG: acylneuraminate cytidylyltransferase family protein [Bacillota bacterium]